MKIDLKEGKIKIVDIIIAIFAIMLIACAFIVIYFSYLKNVDDSSIVISFKNEELEEVYFDSKTYVYKVEAKDEVLYLYKNDELVSKKEVKNIDNFTNIIKIENNTVHMIEATCKNKDCMDMYISEEHQLPIICTNGVTVSLKTKDSKFDIIS